MMAKDHRDIKTLYYIHRFTKASIARLYGVSRPRMNEILAVKDITIISDTNCLLCGLEDAMTYFIDGNEKNQNPQNIICLCEADQRRIKHLQLRRRQGSLIPQS
jgi:hypothetical protein